MAQVLATPAAETDPLTQYRAGIRQLEEAIAVDPENVQLWYSLIQSRSMMEAVEARQRGEAPPTERDRAEAERRSKERTALWIEEWMRAYPDNPALYLARTQLLEVGEQKTNTLRSLVDRFPDHETTVQQLIQDLSYGDLNEEAIGVAEAYLNRNPDSSAAYITLERLYRDAGDRKRAERLVEDWVAAMPGDYQANSTSFTEVMRRGDQQQGLAAARNVTERLSGEDKAKWCRRLTDLYQGQLAGEARTCFEEVLPQLDPESHTFESAVGGYAATLAESGDWSAFNGVVGDLPPAERDRAIRIVAMKMVQEQRCGQAVSMLSGLSDVAASLKSWAHNLDTCVGDASFRELILQAIRQGDEGSVSSLVRALADALPPARLEAALLARDESGQGGKWLYQTLDSLYAGAGWYEKRMTNLEAWRRNDPGSFGGNQGMALAELFLGSGNVDGALSVLEQQLGRDANRHYYQLYEQLASIYLILDRRGDAEALAQQFLATDSREASRGHLLMARIALSADELETAMEHYERFFSQTPADSWQQAEEYKYLLVGEGDEERLVRFLELEWQGAIEMGRRKPGHHDVWMADQLEELGLGERALSLYEGRIRSGDHDPDLIRKAAQLAEGLEEWDRALAIRQVQLEAAPDDAGAWWQVAKHHLTRGDPETTFDVLDTAFDQAERPSAAMWKLWAEAVIATAEDPESIDIDLLTEAIEVLRIAVDNFEDQYYTKISLHHLMVNLYRKLGARLEEAESAVPQRQRSGPGWEVLATLGEKGEALRTEVSASSPARALLDEADRLNSGAAGRIDLDRAQRLYLEAAASGDPLVVVRLGTLLHLGLCNFGAETEAAAALAMGRLEAVRRAAEGGDAKAASVYGLVVLVGVGIEADPPAARQWLEQSAQGGDDWAKYNLGWMYWVGRGVDRDPVAALRWYRLAAERGVAAAMMNIGIAYRDGRGASKDIGAALEWIERSARQGHRIAANQLGQIYLRGEGVPEDFDKGLAWTLAAARLGDRAAAGELARAADIGYWGRERDRAEARHWYEQAAALGSYEAQGWLYVSEHSEY